MVRDHLRNRSRQLGFRRVLHPGYYNNEGGGPGSEQGEGIRSHLGEPYGPGFYAFGDLLKEWRDKGDLDDLELRS